LAKLHADKGYDYPHLRAWLRQRSITPRIARRGVESSQRLGRTAGSSNARWPG
jgi:IS5 family transposase